MGKTAREMRAAIKQRMATDTAGITHTRVFEAMQAEPSLNRPSAASRARAAAERAVGHLFAEVDRKGQPENLHDSVLTAVKRKLIFEHSDIPSNLSKRLREAIEQHPSLAVPYPSLLWDESMPQVHVPYDDWLQVPMPTTAGKPTHGRLPDALQYDMYRNRVKIPEQWELTLLPAQILVDNSTIPPHGLTITGMTRATTIKDLSSRLTKHLKCAAESPCTIWIRNKSTARYTQLSSDMTAQEANLFNMAREVVVATTPLNATGSTLGHFVGDAAQGANAQTHTAPPHNTVLNGLCNGAVNWGASNLNGIGKQQWKTLRSSLGKYNQRPICVCYNCGLLTYLDAGEGKQRTHFVVGLQNKAQCRAYRVFRHFIEVLSASVSGDGSVDSEAVFKCTPGIKGGQHGCHVYACGSCTEVGRDDPASYDLHDGILPNGTRQDIGISDELPDELGRLSADERMSLAVLRMIDATFPFISIFISFCYILLETGRQPPT